MNNLENGVLKWSSLIDMNTEHAKC